MRGPLDAAALRALCATITAETGAVALCRILEDRVHSLADAVEEQRAITRALRGVLRDRAESIAVFVASAPEVEECARAWEATVVLP